jgi:hypothetical protein
MSSKFNGYGESALNHVKVTTLVGLVLNDITLHTINCRITMPIYLNALANFGLAQRSSSSLAVPMLA